MEDVRTVPVDKNAVVVMEVIGVPTDVVAAFHQQHPLAQASGQAFSHDAAGETRADNQEVIHQSATPLVTERCRRLLRQLSMRSHVRSQLVAASSSLTLDRKSTRLNS